MRSLYNISVWGELLSRYLADWAQRIPPLVALRGIKLLHGGVKKNANLACLLLIFLPNYARAIICVEKFSSTLPNSAPPNSKLVVNAKVGDQGVHGSRYIADGNRLYLQDNGKFIPVVEQLGVSEISFITSPSEEQPVLIGASEGLFQLTSRQLERVDGDVETGHVYQISDIDAEGRRVINTSNGLFLVSFNQFLALKRSKNDFIFSHPDMIFFLNEKGSIMIGNDKGLFQLTDNGIEVVDPTVDTGGIYSVSEMDEQGWRFIIAKNGDFKLRDKKLISFPMSDKTGKFRHITEMDNQGRRFISAKNGVFEWYKNKITPYGDGTFSEPVYKIYTNNNSVMALTDKGIYRLTADGFKYIEGSDEVIHELVLSISKYPYIVSVSPHGDVIMSSFSASSGKLSLSIIKSSNLLEPLYVGDISGEGKITRRDQFGKQFIETTSGIFSTTESNVTITNKQNKIPSVVAGSDYPYQWYLSHPCISRVRSSDMVLNGPGKEEATLHIQKPPIPNTLIVQAQGLVISEIGNHSIYLEFTDPDTGKLLSFPFEVHIFDFTTGDLLKKYSGPITVGVLVLHSIIFLGLIWGARWSKRCWQIINDPIWGRFGVWFYFALRHSSRLQRWCLERWFTERRKRNDRDEPYVPVPVIKDTMDTSNISVLLANLKEQPSHRWLQGNAGMGKTTLVSEIERMFYANPNIETLNDVYQNFGFVPLVIPLRNYRAIIPDSKKPEQWLPSIICAALTSEGMQFNDVSLLKSTLHNNRFLLVLDGANEIGHGAELELYAQSSGDTHLFVTSQSLPQHAPDIFQVWHLPLTISDFIEQLLVLNLGKDKGEEVFRHLTKNMLETEIQSGYDVRVLVDLVEATTTLDELPQNRLALYKAMVTTLTLADGSLYPIHDLCKVAWTLYRSGTRTFSVTNEELLSPDLLAPLLQRGCRIVRVQNGDMVEFRHDQMHAYLAAYWVAKCEVSPISLFESETDIWRQARTDQVLLWSFFADLVDKELGTTLWKWAQEEDERHILQHELYLRGKKEKWSWIVGD